MEQLRQALREKESQTVQTPKWCHMTWLAEMIWCRPPAVRSLAFDSSGEVVPHDFTGVAGRDYGRGPGNGGGQPSPQFNSGSDGLKSTFAAP